MEEELVEILEHGGVVEAVHDALVHVDGIVHVLAGHRGAVVGDLVDPVLAAEGQEDRQVAEVIEVMMDRRDAQGAHGGAGA